MYFRFFAYRLSSIIIFISLLGLSFSQSQAQSDLNVEALADEKNTQLKHSFAAIESAEYEAIFSAGDLVDGKFEWKLLHRGTSTSEIDITDANLAMSDLKSGNQEVAWGTTQEKQRVVLIEPNNSVISGNWSLHGRSYPGRTVYHCHLPGALNSRLTVKTPKGITVQSSMGIVQEAPPQKDDTLSIWNIDLGRHRTTFLSLVRSSPKLRSPIPIVEVESVYVARQDGFFVQSDFVVVGHAGQNKNAIEIQSSKTLNVQSVSSNGIPLTYRESNRGGRTLSIVLPATAASSRMNLRIQGFQPARWVRPHKLPIQKISGAIEAKRVANLRIESPLVLHSVQREGFFQSGLSEELRGEVWKFEAFRENPQLIVDLGQQKTSLKTEVHSLNYFDTPLPWVITNVTSSIKSGRLFQVDYELPEEWSVVSIHPLNTESEISSWTVEQQQLSILFKKPLSSDSLKSFEILSRTQIPELSNEANFPVLRVFGSTTTSVQSDWILPHDRDLDLSTEQRWNLLTSKIEIDRFQNSPPTEVDSKRQIHKSFFNSNVNFESLPTYQYISLADMQNENLDTDDPVIDSLSNPSTPEDRTIAPSAEISLLTQADSLGDLTSPRLVHHANIDFSRMISSKELVMSLSEDCLLSSVTVDGQSITALREGRKIYFPESVSSMQSIVLIFITESKRSVFSELCDVPLPVLKMPVTQFHWTLEMPNDRRLKDVKIPGLRFNRKTHNFLFGPLSANRLRSRISDITLTTSESEEFDDSVIRYQFHTLGSVEYVHFEAWDVVESTNFGWVAFFACMIIGVGGRLLRSQMIRKLSPCWLIFLIIAQFWMINGLSMITGAMLAGTLISILLPVEFLRLPEVKTISKTTRKLATACLILGVAITSLGDAQEPTTDGQLTSTTQQDIRYLLRSVVYEADYSSANTYRASIEVLTPSNVENTLVELPYQGVVFPAGAECLVDNQTQTLIPAASGKGVVIRIPSQLHEHKEPAGKVWEKHTIQFRFSLRDNKTTLSNQSDQIFFPVIQESSLMLNQNLLISPEVEAEAFHRLGQVDHFSDGQIQVALGPVQSFIPNTIQSPKLTSEQSFYTLLNISEARITGRLFIPSVVASSQNHLLLDIPEDVTITDVGGSGVLKWFLSQDGDNNNRLIIELLETSSLGDISVAFYSPGRVNTNNEIVLPEFSWQQSASRHILGIESPNGVSISLSEDLQMVGTLPVDLWPQSEFFRRSRPEIVLEPKLGQTLKILLHELKSKTNSQIEETVTVERSKINWQAEINLEVTEMPLFVHQFQLKGGLRINSVRSKDTGQLTQLRYIQNGENLSIIIPGGQLGMRKLSIQGDVSFSPATLRSLPEIVSEDIVQDSSTMNLYDKTNWQIDLVNKNEEITKVDSLNSENISSSRLIGIYENDLSRPEKIRLLPPASATRVDIATRVHIDENPTWNCVQLLHFTGTETPLKKITFAVPNTLEKVRIGPRYFRIKSQKFEAHTEFTIPVPERFSDELTIQIYSKLTKQFVSDLLSIKDSSISMKIPGVQVDSARAVSQFLLFNKNSIVTVPASEAIHVDRKNLPGWIPLQWQEAVNNLQVEAYQVADGNPSVTLQNHSAADEEPLPQFAESLLWNSEDQKIKGMTRLWLTSTKRFVFALPIRNEVLVNRVTLPSQGDLEFIRTNSEYVIQARNASSVSPVIIYWEEPVRPTAAVQSPFNPELTQSFKEIIGVVTNKTATRTIKDLHKKNSFDAMIFRWTELMAIAKSIQVPIEIESFFYKELIESNVRMSELLQKNALTDEQRTIVQQSLKDWEKISENFVIIAGPVASGKEAISASFDPIIPQANQFQSVNWVLPNVENTVKIDLNTTNSVSKITSHAFKSVIILLAAILLYRFRANVDHLVRFIRSKPTIRLLILGGLWLLFFQPIFIGFLLISLAFLVQISRTKDRDLSAIAPS